MGDPEKKRLKAAAKLAKKQAKAAVKAGETPQVASGGAADTKPSPGVRFAESTRGLIYLVAGGSLVVALVLGQQGVIISLDDIITSLFAARAGKVVLALVALALVIYGLKHLRLVR